MTSFYVAGPANEVKQAKTIIRIIQEIGHEVTFDWTRLREEGGEGVIRDTWEGHEEEARVHSGRERQGVIDCDILVFWLPTEANGGKGCYWEAGIASADPQKEIWVLNYEKHNSNLVFYYLDNVKILHTYELIGRLRGTPA